MKIVHYYSQYNVGGTEKVIYSILSNLDKNKFDRYFLSSIKGTNDEELKKANIKLEVINKDSDFENHLYEYFIKNKFDIIHVHNCGEMSHILKIAKKAGIPKIIIHSHVARNDLNKVYWFLKGIKSLSLNVYSNTYFACSKQAAKWLFPLKTKKTYIMLNGIEINKFKYNNEKKIKIRRELDIKDYEYVLMMVSRLTIEKNHKFMLEVMSELLKLDKKYKLVIVGSGGLKDKLKEIVYKTKIEQNVIFVGEKNNVVDYLSASDLYVMPSLFEGLGISAVEAQYNGLKTFVSNNIPEEVDIGENLVKFIPLKKELWKKEILETSLQKYERDKEINSTKYDIYKIIKDVEKEYLK